jgi:uncharacterized membrane protein
MLGGPRGGTIPRTEVLMVFDNEFNLTRVSLFARIAAALLLICLWLVDETTILMAIKTTVAAIAVFVLIASWRIYRPLWATLFAFVAVGYLPFFQWYPNHAKAADWINVGALLIVGTSFIFLRRRKTRKESNSQ